MEAELTGMFLAFVFLLLIFIWQRFAPKIHTFYLCLIAAFILNLVIGAVLLVTKPPGGHEPISFWQVPAYLAMVLVMPGWMLAAFLWSPFWAFDQFDPIVRMMYLFSEIFYAVVLFGIVMFISYVKRRLATRKTPAV